MSNDREPLLAATEEFFRNTPDLAYPAALVGQFPHIANHIVELSYNKEALRVYFDTLAVDNRGGRVGFPFDVLMDIQALREHLIGDVNGFESNDESKWIS